MLRNAKVVDRILVRKKDSVAKQRAKAKRIDIDEQWLLAEYIDTIRLAKADKQYSAVNASITNIAKLLNIGFVDRREINQQINIDATLQALDSGALLDALTSANDPSAIEAQYRSIDGD